MTKTDGSIGQTSAEVDASIHAARLSRVSEARVPKPSGSDVEHSPLLNRSGRQPLRDEVIAFRKPVAYVHGGKKRAYALNNAQEYFAELTETYFGKNLRDEPCEVAILELRRGHVDRHSHLIGPTFGIQAGAAKHPFSEACDHPRLLCDRNEFRGRDQSPRRMSPG